MPDLLPNGGGVSIYSRCSLQSGLALGSSRAKAITGTRQWNNQLQAHAIISDILELSTGCDDHCILLQKDPGGAAKGRQ